MRVSPIIVLIITVLIQVGIPAHAQNITLAKADVSLVSLLKEIQRQSDYGFVYSDKLIVQSKKVSIRVVNIPLTEVLKMCFRDQPFTYEIENKIIVIRARKPDRS